MDNELTEYKLSQIEKRIDRLEKFGLGALIFLAGSLVASILQLVGIKQ